MFADPFIIFCVLHQHVLTAHDRHGDVEEVVRELLDLLLVVLLPEVDQLVAVADATVEAVQHQLNGRYHH